MYSLPSFERVWRRALVVAFARVTSGSGTAARLWTHLVPGFRRVSGVPEAGLRGEMETVDSPGIFHGPHLEFDSSKNDVTNLGSPESIRGPRPRPQHNIGEPGDSGGVEGTRCGINFRPCGQAKAALYGLRRKLPPTMRG